MKVLAPIVVALAAADEKKVPPRHPLQRLATLERFACEWLDMWTSEKVSTHWCQKFGNNVAKFRRRFEICPHYDENQLPHGGPPDRKRRSDDDDDMTRYNREDPEIGIKQITTGFRKWAERYITGCGLQPATQVARANKWYGILLGKIGK
jgi:hypothetical protein